MNVMTAKKKLYRLAQLQTELDKLKNELSEEMEFEYGHGFVDNILAGMEWDTEQIYYNCKIADGRLYNADGILLSKNGECMSEPLGYFVNQSVGYCEDDYFGTMFFQVDDKGTFVAVGYAC